MRDQQTDEREGDGHAADVASLHGLSVERRAELDAVADGLAALHRAATTQRVYLSALKGSSNPRARARRRVPPWLDWCALEGAPPLPASVPVVRRYLAALVQSGASFSTLNTHTSAIAALHRLTGHASPTAAPEVRRLLEGAKRAHAAESAPKKAIGAAVLAAMVRAVPAGKIQARDRAILLFGWASALRRSELAALERRDLEIDGPGVVVHVRRSKTDQHGKGEWIGVPFAERAEFCPVRAVLALLERRADDPDPRLFGCGKRTIARRVQRAAVLAGLPPGLYGAHSLRSGVHTTAATEGAEEREIMRMGRHKSVATSRRYVQRGTVWNRNAAAVAIAALDRLAAE